MCAFETCRGLKSVTMPRARVQPNSGQDYVTGKRGVKRAEGMKWEGNYEENSKRAIRENEKKGKKKRADSEKVRIKTTTKNEKRDKCPDANPRENHATVAFA